MSVPATNYRKDRIIRRHRFAGFYYSAAYEYQWGGSPQIDNSLWGLPRRDGVVEEVATIWTTYPIPAQVVNLSLFGRRAVLPDTVVDGEWYGNVAHHPHFLADGSVKVISVQEFHLTGFFGVGLLSTCKQINAEAATYLYSYNTFSFDTTTASHLENAFDYEPHPSTDDVFDESRTTSTFIQADPFLYFLSQIGRKNASLLRSIRLSGEFKTKILRPGSGYINTMSFGYLLPLYTQIMARIGTNLARISLDGLQGPGLWDRELVGNSQTVHEVLDSIVYPLVEGLPGLQRLDLGYRRPEHTVGLPNNPLQVERDKVFWDKALYWVKFVEKRSFRIEIPFTNRFLQKIPNPNQDAGAGERD
ncbi:uncharacterized protein PAC_05301 [Phialocephala subalpina]|uniref:Uncharacterized protein n=1 Tax=Phialocephala subalpina TaxID=576137 RepID=A0A1L7WRL7_9HELO|nr:uncharacterized protein PAC_05301 [Phialocephala subalpina]